MLACMSTVRFHCTKLDLEAFMDLMASMSLIYGTTSLDTGTKWRRLVPPPHFPTLWLAGAASPLVTVFKCGIYPQHQQSCTRYFSGQLEYALAARRYCTL